MPIQCCLITGGAGFVGSNLVKRCIDDGIVVDIVDDMSNGHVKFIHAGVRNKFFCDFTSSQIDNMIKKQSYSHVFHLAARPRVSYSVQYPLQAHEINMTKSLKFLQMCCGNIERFIFASSSSVYGGATTLPTPESYPLDPKSPYALQKMTIEHYCRLYSHLYDLDTVCLRFFNVFGKNCLGNSAYATAIAAWLTAIKSGNLMKSEGTGEQSRDLCYIDNVTDACVLAAKYQRTLLGNAFNIACGDKITNNEILMYLKKRYPSAMIEKKLARKGDVMHTLADIDKATFVLGYKPSVGAWMGIEKTCDWFDENWDKIKDI